MGSTPGIDERVCDEQSGAPEPLNKPVIPGTEKEINRGEFLPGWTIMRPLRKRGNKSSAANADVSRNGDGTKDSADGDIKITETNESGNPIGEVEALHDLRSDDELLGDDEEEPSRATRENANAGDHTLQSNDGTTEQVEVSGGGEYKVYKRRWFGLVQLVLLNIIVSWDWLTFAASSTTVSEYYKVSESAINWLSTGFLFAFVVISPVVVYTLHRGGPKPSIVAASVLIFVGNWIRYGATRAGTHGNFGGVMFGQILCGFAQPFVLAAPTRYSDLWFTNRGRVAATAIMSLANPFGGALAQLIDPFWANAASDIPNMVLYIAIISSVATIPSFFIPAQPPTPCSPSATHAKQPLMLSIRILYESLEFWLIMIPFTIYVALFNSVSSLINQILEPYGFSEDNAGIAGALLIVVGLVAAAIISPIIDKTKSFLLAIKVLVPLMGLSYLAFTFAPGTRSLGAVFVILSILGAASFSAIPVVLEYLIEITHPVSPEVTSVISWTGGQLVGGIFIIISDALRAGGPNDGSADDGTKRPPGNMYKALVFSTAMALVVVPLPLALGFFGRSQNVRMRRVDADKAALERRTTGDSEGGIMV
ncbi:Peramine biosynthesis cluster [Hyphodiscus hymeniophilus]|uniref:Peramine biosynthesis cluster n=1 Tax=Hyphodiscus hymeniophilus TaxID=353542 RepID=A0A9P6VIC6_9HELO|nr:Peramine biosynthesis cluster [Hyphodiscus hymeniophilus]